MKGKKVKKEEKVISKSEEPVFPSKFPFWARLKIAKNRTTLVIDEEEVFDKVKRKNVEGFVHREATHSYKKEYEKVYPNPDRSDKRDMYLKRPAKLPKKLFKPHNKNLDMPNEFVERYDKNNKKE